MSDFLINLSGELVLKNGDLVFCNAEQEIPQILRTRFKTFLGEWFADQSLGVPYYQGILVKNPDPIFIDAVFKNIIIETPGVLELLEFELDYNGETRALQVIFSARTIDGLINFSEEISL